jgi:hypothetical protein
MDLDEGPVTGEFVAGKVDEVSEEVVDALDIPDEASSRRGLGMNLCGSAIP